MTQPRWMQAPLSGDKNEPRWKKAELLSEGGYRQPYGNTSMGKVAGVSVPIPTDPEQLSRLKEDSRVPFMSRKERFLAGHPAEEGRINSIRDTLGVNVPSQKTNQAVSAGIGYADATTGGQLAELEGRKAAYPTFGSVPGSAHIARAADQAGLLPDWAGGGQGRDDMAKTFEGGFEGMQAKAQTDNPFSYLGGQIAGYLTPGSALWSGTGNTVKAIPGMQQLATQIGKTGRVPSWLGRMITSGVGFGADAAVYGATVGGSDLEAQTGQDATLRDSTDLAKQYALASVGEMGDAMGIEVPSWARQIPVSMVMPMAGSLGERSLKGVTSGGRTVTPDRIQANVLNSVGRAPSANSTARGMAEIVNADRAVSGSDIKTFRFIENALRDAGEQVGLSRPAIRDLITDGFDRIHKSIPTRADGRTPLAVLIEREFAEDFGPGVTENLRKFLLKVGLDDPGVTRNFIDTLRNTQVDDFRKLVDDNLGSQSAIDFEQVVAQGLDKKLQSRQAVIDKAKEVANDGPIAQSLREHLLDSEFKGLLQGEASKHAWQDVDTFINQDPWNAANVLQAQLGRQESASFNSGNAAQYAKLMQSKEWIQDMLGRSDDTGLPGYNRLTGQIAAESRVRENLGYTDGFGKKHPGFGADLKKASRSARDTQRMVERYQGETPQDIASVARLPNKGAKDLARDRSQAAARISTGEVLKDQLRGARPGGTNDLGQDVVGLRLADMQTVGMMDSMKDVFGAPGENIADGVNQLVNRRQFLADIDPKTGSPTANKQIAMATGEDAFTDGLGRSINTDQLADALFFANGIPPVVTMLRSAPGWLRAPFKPNRGQRADIARTLLDMPQGGANTPPPTPIVPPLTGHSNPQWQSNKRWEDPVLIGPPGGPVPPKQAGFIDPELLQGNTFPVVAGAYGAINPQDVPGTSEGINWQDRAAYAAILAGGAKMFGKMGGRPPGGPTPPAANGFIPGGPLPPTPIPRPTAANAVTASQGRPATNGIPSAPLAEMGVGGIVGGNIPVDYDGDGEVTMKDRAMGAVIGASGSQVPRAANRATNRVLGSRNLPGQTKRFTERGNRIYQTEISDGGIIRTQFSKADDGKNITVSMDAFQMPGKRYVPRPSGGQREVGSVAQAKEVFDTTFRAVQDHATRHKPEGYVFSGTSASRNKLYANQMRRIGVPDGYVGIIRPREMGGTISSIVRKGSEQHRYAQKFHADDWEIVTKTSNPRGQVLKSHATPTNRKVTSADIDRLKQAQFDEIYGRKPGGRQRVAQSLNRTTAREFAPFYEDALRRVQADEVVMRQMGPEGAEQVALKLAMEEAQKAGVQVERITPETLKALQATRQQNPIVSNGVSMDTLKAPGRGMSKAMQAVQRYFADPTDPRRMLPHLEAAGANPVPGQSIYDAASNPRPLARALAEGTGEHAPGAVHPLDGVLPKQAGRTGRGAQAASQAEQRVQQYLNQSVSDDVIEGNARTRIEAHNVARTRTMDTYRSSLRQLAERYQGANNKLQIEAGLRKLMKSMPGMTHKANAKRMNEMVRTHMAQIERGNVRAYPENAFQWNEAPPLPARQTNQGNAEVLRQEQARIAHAPPPRPMDPRTARELADLSLNPARADEAMGYVTEGRHFDSFGKSGQVSALALGAAGAGLAAQLLDQDGNPIDPAAIARAENQRLLNSYTPSQKQEIIGIQSALVAQGMVKVPKSVQARGPQAVERYYRDWIDGSWGKNTRNALHAFQAKNGLPATGKMTPATAELLYEEMAEAS